MRKEHRCKREREFEPENLHSCKNYDLLNEFEDLPRKKKKHKSHKIHKYKINEDDSFPRNCVKESSAKISEKVIHIHGSSSEEENSHSRIQERNNYKNDSDAAERHTENSAKKRHLSRKHTTNDSGTEGKYLEHHKRHRSSDSKYFKKEDRKVRERSSEKNHYHSKFKVTNDSDALAESLSTQSKKHIKVKPKEEKNRSSSPESRNNISHNKAGNKKKETHEWGGSKAKSKSKAAGGEVQKPNFSLSGKLAEDTNIFNGVVIKYSEPPEARMPKKRWRLYPFKGDQGLPTLYIHRQSAYLLGRDRKVADIPIDHPSCSKQHAALQYRLVPYHRSDGSLGKQIKLYIIDLESANGTFINNNKIEPKQYVELFEKDVIKFGFSSREYVLLHEHSKDDEIKSEDES